MRLKGKFGFGFGVVLFLMLGMGAAAFIGIGGMVESAREAGRSRQLRSEFKQRLVEHFQWAQAVNLYLLDEEIQELDVELDPTQCGLGSWYGGEERRRAEEDVPALKPLLKQLDEPHRRLHHSAEALETAQKAGREKEAREIYLEEIEPALRDVQGLMERIDTTIEGALVTNEGLMEQAVNTRLVLAAAAVLALVIGLTAAVFISRSILGGLYRTIDFTSRLTEGDLRGHLELRQRDELGDMGRSLDGMVEKLRGMMGEIGAHAGDLHSSSGDLAALSQRLTGEVEKAAERGSSVAASSEELTTNSQGVSSGISQAAGNLNNVASAAEEMRATVEELSRNAARGKDVTGGAVEDVEQISRRVENLKGAAERIGKVTETITDISYQTNLLALNATIEAARAGSAGKGFGVVANEIKELAGQTSTSTENIQEIIGEIQEAVQQTVADIGGMGTVVADVDEIVTSIAAAAEEQAATTGDIAENIAQASQGVQDADERMTQNVEVSQGISSEIAEVARSNDEIREESGTLAESAQALAGIAEDLRRSVQFFRLGESVGESEEKEGAAHGG